MVILKYIENSKGLLFAVKISLEKGESLISEAEEGKYEQTTLTDYDSEVYIGIKELQENAKVKGKIADIRGGGVLLNKNKIWYQPGRGLSVKGKEYDFLYKNKQFCNQLKAYLEEE